MHKYNILYRRARAWPSVLDRVRGRAKVSHIQPPGTCLYTRYPIVARRAWPAGRVRRASKGILHTRYVSSVYYSISSVF